MYPRRSTDERAEAMRSDAAARRLASIAATAPGSPTLTGSAEPDGDDWWADHTRVAEVREPVAEDTLPAAPVIPVPGRHASRRRRPSPIVGLRAALRDRAPSLGPSHVAVVAIALAIGLAITTWWVARDQPVNDDGPVTVGEPVAPLLAGTTPTGRASASGAQGGSVTVDVAGKVRRPGIVVLDQGSRVTDALEAAGGARRGVDLVALNLARVLVDGEQIVVGAPAGAAPAGAPGPTGGSGAPGATGPLVNLNLASQAELESLPQVGPVTAQSIIAWRDQRGGFTSVDELLEVDGIGQKTLERLSPYVTV